jgi:hypothetical protein
LEQKIVVREIEIPGLETRSEIVAFLTDPSDPANMAADNELLVEP